MKWIAKMVEMKVLVASKKILKQVNQQTSFSEVEYRMMHLDGWVNYDAIEVGSLPAFLAHIGPRYMLLPMWSIGQSMLQEMKLKCDQIFVQ